MPISLIDFLGNCTKGVQQFSRYVTVNDMKKMFSSAEANHSLATTKIMLMPEKILELKVQGFT